MVEQVLGKVHAVKQVSIPRCFKNMASHAASNPQPSKSLWFIQVPMVTGAAANPLTFENLKQKHMSQAHSARMLKDGNKTIESCSVLRSQTSFTWGALGYLLQLLCLADPQLGSCQLSQVQRASCCKSPEAHRCNESPFSSHKHRSYRALLNVPRVSSLDSLVDQFL